MQIYVYLRKICNIVSQRFRIWMMKFSPTLCRCPWCSACCWTCASPSCQSSSCGPPPDAWPININFFRIGLWISLEEHLLQEKHTLSDSTSKLEQPIVYLESKNCVQSMDPSYSYIVNQSTPVDNIYLALTFLGRQCLRNGFTFKASIFWYQCAVWG